MSAVSSVYVQYEIARESGQNHVNLDKMSLFGRNTIIKANLQNFLLIFSNHPDHLAKTSSNRWAEDRIQNLLDSK